MADYVRSHLGVKIFLSYLAIVLIGLLVLGAASQFALPSSFDRHMLGMMAADGTMPPGMGMGIRPPGPGSFSSRAEVFRDYRASFNDALLIAGALALVAALGLSFFFSRGIVGPVRALSLAAQRIAAGHYDERVPAPGSDELSQLAARFNQMAEKLAQVETMRRRLIGDVSHELRTPLTAIQGSMEGLMDGVLPPTDETFQQIHEEAQRLDRLVNDLQELSRVEAQAYELQLSPTEITTPVATVTKRLTAQAADRKIGLVTDLAPDLPRVLADEDRLVQVLTNLTSNALQYTPEGGLVTIGARKVNGDVVITVRDTGIGIPLAHLPRIFDRFYRVDKSRSRQSGGGSGIGLTIARALVEAHGGHMWVESPGADQGSVFSFTLPVAG